MDEAMNRVFMQLIEGNVGLAIAELDVYLTAWPHPQTKDKLDLLNTDYQCLVECWKQGIYDPRQQEEQYQRLLQQVYVLSANIAIYRHMMGSSYLQQLYKGVRNSGENWRLSYLKEQLQDFVSETAMLELEPEHQRAEKSKQLYQEHQQLMNRLFNYVLTSHIWTPSIGESMEELLLSPTIDDKDQQQIVSAITLSAMNRFDMVKFRLLTRVYQQSLDAEVRQRALVGWVLSMNDNLRKVYPEQESLVRDLLKKKSVCQELTELQMQLLYTESADKDSEKIQQEIIPELMKNQNLHITQDGIEEKDDDPLEDVLHPDAAEQRMEKVEASFRQMMDMQKQGIDIYFGGFSQMKRYPFFYDISNWFVPFYLQHPDIRQFMQQKDYQHVLKIILSQGAFCHSDRYSLVIAFQQVVSTLSENMREMLKRRELAMEDMGIPEETKKSSAYLRRCYLMDLYRFFKLFPNRSYMLNPFDGHGKEAMVIFFFDSPLLQGSPVDDYKPEVMRLLLRRHSVQMKERLLQSFPEQMRDVQYYLWKGDYDKVLELDADNERALAEQARRHFDRASYADAEALYERLVMLHPAKMSYMLNRAVCLVNMEEYDDALKLLYQLSFEHEDNLNVQRVMAWAFTCSNKLEQAVKVYQHLLAQTPPVSEDIMNYGFCLWLQGRVDDAAQRFSEYMSMEHLTEEHTDRVFNSEWLKKRGIHDIDIKLMKALALSH